MKRKLAVAAALVVGAGAASGGAAIAAGGDDDGTDSPITGVRAGQGHRPRSSTRAAARSPTPRSATRRATTRSRSPCRRQPDRRPARQELQRGQLGERPRRSGRELSFASCPQRVAVAEPAATRSLPKPKHPFVHLMRRISRNFHSAGGGSRTHTGSRHGATFSPLRLPFRHPGTWVTDFRGLGLRPGSAPARSRGVDRRSSRTPRR